MAPEKDKVLFQILNLFAIEPIQQQCFKNFYFSVVEDTVFDIIDKFYEIIDKNSLIPDKKDSLYV